MERVKTFVNGGREYPADLNAIQDRAAELLEGLASAIPSSHFAGRYYRATDTGDLYLDNGTTWTKIAGKEAIEAANIKSEAVTDAKIVKGRALVETENAYSAPTARTKEVEYEPSSTRMAFVTVNGSSTSAFAFTPFVGGVDLGQTRASLVSGVAECTQTFLCPPKAKWKVVTEATSIESSYLLL